MTKEIIGVAATAIALIAFLPYIRSVHQGRTKPHVFSWIIWGSTTFIVFLAQLADQGGAGAWPIGVSGLITLYVAALAFAKRSDIKVTRTDWLFFLAAMAALPAWFLTADPLWAVVILTTVDVLGFGPTIRKIYDRPYDEHPTFYTLILIRNLISMAALQNYTLTTLLFPAATGIATMVFLAVMLVRRRAMAE